MERWEVIERYVLLAAWVALILLAGWPWFFPVAPGRFGGFVLVVPCIFWVFWQALYEDKLASGEPPSSGERFMRPFCEARVTTKHRDVAM